jgi:hypothetical protein
MALAKLPAPRDDVSMTTDMDREITWCADFERLLRQRRIRLRYRRSTKRGAVYTCERPSGESATVWVPRGAIGAGVYGLNAALLEVEEVLSANAHGVTEAAARSKQAAYSDN